MKEEKPSFLSSFKKKKSEKQHLNNLNYDLQYFVDLDNENKICFDCGGPFPTFVSINNGVFICESCAKNHKKLGYNISYIHQICSPWDPYLLAYAIRGGNTRFKLLCKEYKVPCQSFYENNEERLNKYIIKLGEYNRLVLKSEILADEPPVPLYYEDAKKKCNLNIIHFPEFQNYHLYKGEFNIPNDKSSIGRKIWKGTKTTAGAVGYVGESLYKATKQSVNLLSKSASKGVKYLKNNLWNNHYNRGSKNVYVKNNNIINNNDNNNIYINYNDNLEKNKKTNDFYINNNVDDDDYLLQIKKVDLNNPKINKDINYNVNSSNNNDINNIYKFCNINNNNYLNNKVILNNNNNSNNQYGNENNHNIIIENHNYDIYNEVENENNNSNINKKIDNSSNKNIIHLNNKIIDDGFEIIS